jgi:hypothetical protein
MPSATNLLGLENSREAGVVGGVAALIAATVVTTVGPDIGNEGLAVGGLTVPLFFVVLVALNVSRRFILPAIIP